MGSEGLKADLAKICQALGVKRIKVIDPYRIKDTEAVLKEELNLDELSVVITNRPCVLYPPEMRKEVRQKPFHVYPDRCIGCHTCFKVSCPAISESDQKTSKGLTQSRIDPILCTGCSVCAQVCPVDAIKRVK